MNTESYKQNDALMKLLHDISGPIATSSGIQRELAASIKLLVDEIRQLEADLPQSKLIKLQTLIQADIEPCLSHLSASLSTLNGRIKDFSAAAPAERG